MSQTEEVYKDTILKLQRKIEDYKKSRAFWKKSAEEIYEYSEKKLDIKDKNILSKSLNDIIIENLAESLVDDLFSLGNDISNSGEILETSRIQFKFQLDGEERSGGGMARNPLIRFFKTKLDIYLNG